MRFLLIVAIAALVALRGRGRPERLRSAIDRALDARWAPLVAGLLWAAGIALSWGTLRPAPVFHDEISYVLQANLFAHGRWSAPSPPLADMWAQAHVLVAPVMASKYPPGHALLLALGALVGQPALVVLLLAVLRGAMTFALARRLANGPVALVTTAFLLHGDSLHWGASFFSETTTGALVLVCWYALLRWHDERRTAWLALAAASLGWCAITRPVTALAFAIPIGVVVLRGVWRTRRWRDLGTALAVGTAIVALLPLWSARTTGDWRLWPATLYTRDYMPYDYPHFGVVAAQPRRELPGDLAAIAPSLVQEERAHTLARAPRIALVRFRNLALATWWAPLVALPLAIAGLVGLPAAAWVGVATVVTLFFGYLAHPTWAAWTIYYMEIAPVLTFLTACGLARLYRAMARGREGDAEAAPRRAVPRPTMPLAVAGILPLLLILPGEASEFRRTYEGTSGYQAQFRQAIAPLPGPAVLFVRHAPWHSPHLSLITNGPDWAHANVWIVADRGEARNAALMRLAGGRRAFLFDEGRQLIHSYTPGTTP